LPTAIAHAIRTAEILKQRVKDAAKEACKQVETLYPNEFVASGEAAYEKAAIDDGMVQANAAVAAVERPLANKLGFSRAP
jgi:hypothetical protein